MIQKQDYIEDLKSMTKNEILWFIRASLIKDGEKLSFNMSGYDNNKKGSCTVHNQNILNTFSYLGIYDYTKFLFLDFYKGGSAIYLMYWESDDFIFDDDFFNGYSTSEIIYEIFKLTIFSNKAKRRRG